MTRATTNAVRMHTTGAPDVLALEAVAMPTPAEGEVRIAVHVAGLNYPDMLIRGGRLPARTMPFTPGVDVAGVVDAVGSGVSGELAVGARVVAALFKEASGGYAEHVVTSASSVTVLPDDLAFEHAVALPVQGLTALLALRIAGRVAPGDAVFVPAAAGGVGSLAVQLARRLGARIVVGGASTSEKRRLVLDLGADAVVDYTRASWSEDLRAATGGVGADVILEAGGGAMFEESLRALAPSGRLVVFGAEDAVNPPVFDAAKTLAFLRQGQAFVGFSLLRVPESVRRAALAELIASARSLRVIVERYALADAARAHAAMEARKTQGKVVLLTERASETPRAALAKFVAAMEAFSADALADVFAEDAIYEFPFLNPARPERYDGREAIRAGFRAVWIPGRVRIDDVRTTIHDTSDPEVVIAEGELDATHVETGRSFASRFVLVVRARGGRIVHLRDYMDAIRIARGMGRLPELVAAFA
jgi:NADPH2:quinone reductase